MIQQMSYLYKSLRFFICQSYAYLTSKQRGEKISPALYQMEELHSPNLPLRRHAPLC